jgi:menaquinone-dependent protoporphyrinogen oxidase
MYRWHKDALRFLSRHCEALTERPVGIFALGPTLGDVENWQGSHEQLDKTLEEFPWLTPVALEPFGGKIDPAKIRFPYKLFMRQVPASDLRDWTTIRAWANSLPAKFW